MFGPKKRASIRATIERFSSPINFNADRAFVPSTNRPGVRKNFIKRYAFSTACHARESLCVSGSENNGFSISESGVLVLGGGEGGGGV